MDWWESAYEGSPPWDIGTPQPEIIKLVENDEIPKGRVLDIGCGTGDNSIFLAKNGFSATCMDIAHLAINKGKTKATEQKTKVDFRVGDALKLDKYFNPEYFNAVIDSGLFHTISDDERPVFAEQIRRVLVNSGKYFMLCFSDKEPGNAGPRRISKKEIEHTFSKTFKINYIKDAFFATKWDGKGPKAYLTSMTKINNSRSSDIVNRKVHSHR
jgi:ubiquinone/menaquinone biosynthesis C-methylase UbiE